MTDNDVIKAMKCCIEDDCDECPCSFGNCYTNLIREALYIINRQKAEIEQFADIGKLYSEIKAEVIKKFAERLKENIECGLTYDGGILRHVIDRLAKEMTEGNTNDR